MTTATEMTEAEILRYVEDSMQRSVDRYIKLRDDPEPIVQSMITSLLKVIESDAAVIRSLRESLL